MNDWRSTTLGNVITLQRGFDLPSRLRRHGNVPIVSSSGISGWHDHAMSKAPGVVTGRYGTIGEVFLQEIDFWPLNTTLWVSDFHGNDERFVYYMLQRVDFSKYSGKSGVPGVNRNDVHTEPVALPSSIGEQRIIAEAISDCDKLITKLECLIAKKEAIKKGLMQQLLTGKIRLPSFTDPWIYTHLGEIARIKTGSRNNKDKEALGKYPFFVRSETVERINSYSYDCEAILVPGEGGIGSIFHYINGKFEVHQRVYKVSEFCDQVSGRFVYHYLRQFFGKHAIENSVKATVDSLRLPTFNGFKLHLPTELNEQQEIVSVLDNAESEIDLLQRRLTKAQDIKKGMMQELLTGRTCLSSKENKA